MELKFSHYGEERPVNATDGENAIFETLVSIIKANGQDPAPVRLTRKSDNYVTTALGVWDIARFKWTDRAKWIQFPYAQDYKTKHKIKSTDDLWDYEDEIIRHYSKALEYMLSNE